MSGVLSDKDWDLLLNRIEEGRCTPFLGAGVGFGVLPLGCDIAKRWAAEHQYPLHDHAELPRVAQFLAVTQDPMFPKEEVQRQFSAVPPPRFADSDEPHGLLAELPLPVYITTNYDSFMEQALRNRGRDVRREFCRWNASVRSEPSLEEAEPGFSPTVANPVVFHLHGYHEIPESLVLTEDDYLDFLINLSKDHRLLPLRIERAFTGASLLFLGYSIRDWDFRVLFRMLVSYMERSIRRAHVSVQILPVETSVSVERRDAVQRYLDHYFGELDVRVYWDTCRAFTVELRKRWETHRIGSAAR